MLIISDNTATDVVLRVAGGAAAVTDRMRALGIEGINVDRSTLRLIADWMGVSALPPDSAHSQQSFARSAGAITAEQRRAANTRFDEDPRDTSTPEAMALLLQKIYRQEGIGSASSALLLDIMKRSTTGELRLKGLLPPGVVVAHKTGSIGGTINDVGIITLPDNAGHVIAVVFIKQSPLPTEARERAVAQVARAIYDFFLFNPGR
jgi:beta-lactamase class A